MVSVAVQVQLDTPKAVGIQFGGFGTGAGLLLWDSRICFGNWQEAHVALAHIGAEHSADTARAILSTWRMTVARRINLLESS